MTWLVTADSRWVKRPVVFIVPPEPDITMMSYRCHKDKQDSATIGVEPATHINFR